MRNPLAGLFDSPSRWLSRQGTEEGLSPELTRVFAEATERLLAPHLTFPEKQAVLRTALARLRRAPHAEQREIADHLRLLDRLVPLLCRLGRRFGNLSPEARRKCLLVCERSRWTTLSAGHAKLRHLVQSAYLECPELWARAEERGRPAHVAATG